MNSNNRIVPAEFTPEPQNIRLAPQQKIGRLGAIAPDTTPIYAINVQPAATVYPDEIDGIKQKKPIAVTPMLDSRTEYKRLVKDQIKNEFDEWLKDKYDKRQRPDQWTIDNRLWPTFISEKRDRQRSISRKVKKGFKKLINRFTGDSDSESSADISFL